MSRHRAPVGARVVGAGLPHDTRRPDVETASDAYAARFTGPVGEWLLAEQTATATTLLQRTEGRLDVLDVGGGHGQLTGLLVGLGHRVVVHGSAPECFVRFRCRRVAGAERAQPFVSGLWELPFRDGAFDLALAVRLLGHTAAWQALIAEMARVSRRYLLLEFARSSAVTLPLAADLVFALKRRIENTTRPFFSYRERVLRRELDRHGFRVVASAAQFAVPMVVHRAAGRPAASRRVEGALRRMAVGNRWRSPVMLLAERSGRA